MATHTTASPLNTTTCTGGLFAPSSCALGGGVLLFGKLNHQGALLAEKSGTLTVEKASSLRTSDADERAAFRQPA